jgi:hypothetical protein
MGAGASTVTPNQSFIQLKKHCPNIVCKLDEQFYNQGQREVRRRPVYGVDDTSGQVVATITWDKDVNESKDSENDKHHKLRQEYIRAWDYFEWIFRETTENKDKIAEQIRDKRVVEFTLHHNGDTRSTNMVITGAKRCGNTVDCFKASRKNYWLARLTKHISNKSRQKTMNKYDSRRNRQTRNLIKQDFHTHTVC